MYNLNLPRNRQAECRSFVFLHILIRDAFTYGGIATNSSIECLQNLFRCRFRGTRYIPTFLHLTLNRHGAVEIGGSSDWLRLARIIVSNAVHFERVVHVILDRAWKPKG